MLQAVPRVEPAPRAEFVDQLGDPALCGLWLQLCRDVRAENLRTGEGFTLKEGRYVRILSHVHSDGKRVTYGLCATWLVVDADLLGCQIIASPPPDEYVV